MKGGFQRRFRPGASAAGAERFIEQVAESLIKHLDLSLRDRNRARPIVGDYLGGQVVLGRWAHRHMVSKQGLKLLRRRGRSDVPGAGQSAIRRHRGHTGFELFTATRTRIEIVRPDEAAQAAARSGGVVSLTGSGEFCERMARQAAREGIRVVDADLACIVRDKQARMAREVAGALDGWRDEARRAGISRADSEILARAFAAHAEYRGKVQVLSAGLEGEEAHAVP